MTKNDDDDDVDDDCLDKTVEVLPSDDQIEKRIKKKKLESSSLLQNL